MPLTRLLPFVLLVALTGCGMFETPVQREMRNSPDYKVGYDDGCATAGSQGANPRQDSTVRDEESYRSNPAYRAGWGTGFGACRLGQTQPTPPGLPGMSP